MHAQVTSIVILSQMVQFKVHALMQVKQESGQAQHDIETATIKAPAERMSKPKKCLCHSI